MSTQPSLNPSSGGRTLSEGAINRNNQSDGAVTATRPRPPQASAPLIAVQKRVSEIEHHLKALKAELAVLACVPVPIYKAEPTLDQIVGCVARQWGMNPEIMFRKCNAVRYLVPRRAAQYIMRKHTSMSIPQIGRFFGQHHTTVIHSMRVLKQTVETDPDLMGRIKLVERALRVDEAVQ